MTKSSSPSAASAKSTLKPSRATPWRASLFRLLLALPLLAGACAAPPSQETAMPTPLLPCVLTLTTPTAGWSLQTTAAYRVSQEIWVIHQLTPPEGMAAQVISEATTSVKIAAEPHPLRHFVLGKTWAWKSNPELTFIHSLDELKEPLANSHTVKIVRD